jgi:hypothetical protein
MHTVSETRAFQRQAADAGMTEAEIAALVTYLAANPAAGDEMAGTGGCRRFELPAAAKAKAAAIERSLFTPAQTFRFSCWRFCRKAIGRISASKSAMA